MAGALSGAFLGIKNIKPNWISILENINLIKNIAQDIFVYPNNKASISAFV
jgi:ADP-ribosylglycohydrolase